MKAEAASCYGSDKHAGEPQSNNLTREDCGSGEDESLGRKLRLSRAELGPKGYRPKPGEEDDH
jgi:hypothetical protein